MYWFFVFCSSVAFIAGCSLFGGTDISPIAKIAQKTAQVMKKQEDLDQKFESVQGDIAVTRNDLTEFKTEINNKIDQSTTNNNESLKSLAWTAAGIWFLYELLKFVRALIIAKLSPGNTLANLVKGTKNAK